MNTDFVNKKDRIIASAIEIISETGLASLTTKTLAMKENMTESLLYRYFGGIEEVLVEVVDTFTRFDDRIVSTIEAKDIPHIEKAVEYISTYSTYYEGYDEIGALVLNYEELLHNVNTREAIMKSLEIRTSFVRRELKAAMDEGEILDIFTPEELANLMLGSLNRDLLNRRIQNVTERHVQVAISTLNKMMHLLRKEKE